MNKELIDKAWACLPREFKEEVKKMRWSNHYTEEQVVMIRLLFGDHNLTSDAEREEMLTVPRKDIVELYQEVQKTINQCKGTELAMRSIGIRNVLWSFFDSKCLPDEEPKAAEPKYHVGDWVRVISTDKYGYIGKITEVEINDSIFYRITSVEGWLFLEKNLEPYTETKETILQPFCQRLESAANTEPKDEVVKMKPIESKVSVYLATKKEDEEFRMLLHENGFMWNMGNSLIDKSNWASDPKDYQIHFVYPDMTVTYCGERTMDTLTFNEFKKRYFDEDVNLSHESANCAKQFDNILKDGFSKERRLNIAAMAMQGLLNATSVERFTLRISPESIAEAAFEYADALINMNKKGVTP